MDDIFSDINLDVDGDLDMSVKHRKKVNVNELFGTSIPKKQEVPKTKNENLKQKEQKTNFNIENVDKVITNY